jgi:hypothetical protein
MTGTVRPPELTPNIGPMLRCVRETLEIWITPALQGRPELSYVTTAAHLVAYAERRIDLEGQMLFDEIARLHALLPSALDWLSKRPDSDVWQTGLAAALAYRRDPGIYPSLALLAGEVARLRQHVCDLLELLNADDAAGRTNSEGACLHAALRDYIAWQLEQEGQIVEPAFRGHGPRR